MLIFPNPPITEAVLDIRAEVSPGCDQEALESIHDHVEQDYPKLEPQTQVRVNFQVTPESQALNQESGFRGFFFRAPQKNQLFQARLDGFTFNKLKPYNDWKSFSEEARRLWNLYRKIAKPTSVSRIALRYINKIMLPLPFRDFREYVLTSPEVAPELPQALDHFLLRIVFTDPGTSATAVITQTIEQPIENRTLPLVFDIDVWSQVGHDEVDDKMWERFEGLRNLKNDIFLKSLTPKAKGLFQ